MGIQRIESVHYSVDDIAECVRFFDDFGLHPIDRDETRASFTTAIGQTVRLSTEDEPDLPPALEPTPTIREIVWGVDTSAELEKLVSRVATDRTVRLDPDGVYRTVDESGYGLGLTLARAQPVETTSRPSNSPANITRWNSPLSSVGRVRPLRICHVALNIPKLGQEKAVAFYVERLGFTPTDIVEPMGVFMQCEGDDDQHNFLLCHRPDRAGINHVAYEVPGFDDVIEGANYMIEQGWTESRKLGRHTIGSNVFRFVQAPCGGRVEYAADMDRADKTYGTHVYETTPPHHIWTLRSSRDAQDSAHS